jgi:hypothetical protein
VEINSADGAWVRMSPVGYQFGVEPPSDPAELAEWDDWLVVAVAAGTADGRTWSFQDPCLTTGEAEDLALWLRRRDGEEAAPAFTEPNLAFRVAAARSVLEVDFSHESLPPWLPGSGLGRVYSLRLDVPAGALALAAEQWAAEVAAFPRRAG